MSRSCLVDPNGTNLEGIEKNDIMHATESCCLRNDTSINGPISYEASPLEWASQLFLDDDFEDDDNDSGTVDELESTIRTKLSAASARIEERLMSKHIKSGRIKDEHASADVKSSFCRYRFQSTTTDDDLGLRRKIDAATSAAAAVTTPSSMDLPPNNTAQAVTATTPSHDGHRHRRTNSCPMVELGEMFNSSVITEELYVIAPQTRTVEVASEILAARKNKAAAA